MYIYIYTLCLLTTYIHKIERMKCVAQMNTSSPHHVHPQKRILRPLSELEGPPSLLAEVASTASQQVARFDAGNLAIACWALAALGCLEEQFFTWAVWKARRAWRVELARQRSSLLEASNTSLFWPAELQRHEI